MSLSVLVRTAFLKILAGEQVLARPKKAVNVNVVQDNINVSGIFGRATKSGKDLYGDRCTRIRVLR